MIIEIIMIFLMVVVLLKLKQLEEAITNVGKKVDIFETILQKIESKLKDNYLVNKKEEIVEKSQIIKEEVVKKQTVVLLKTESKKIVDTPPLEKKVIKEIKEPVLDLTESEADYIKEPSFIDKLKSKYNIESIEEILFGNIILKISVIAFILGVGLFLKYSIDKDWIPIWGRALLGVTIGIFMLFGGIKFINNKNKLFSEGLFGGGIAILYLSIFAGFALEGFKFIPFVYAFVSMILITILAGIIAIRFDAKSTAIFGLIGGFATPFLISTGSENIVGLLTYMLILNLCILYISIYKKWSILTWLAFGITALTQLGSSARGTYDFISMSALFASFFVIYSIVPFINEIKQKKETLVKSFLILFGINFLVVIASFFFLFGKHNIELKYFAIFTIILAIYLMLYVFFLNKKNLFMKNLFYVILGQSISLLLVTPALIFTNSSLTIIWAVESLLLLWIASKNKEQTYVFFALIGYAITILKYTIDDLSTNFIVVSTYSSSEDILPYVKELSITSAFVFSSLFVAYKILQKTSFEIKVIQLNIVQYVLFITTLVLSFVAFSSVSNSLLSNDYFIIVFIALITGFITILSKSEYKDKSKFIINILFGLLLFVFINIVEYTTYYISEPKYIFLSFVHFFVFFISFVYIYRLVFKDSKKIYNNYKISNIMLTLGITLLFVFLNFEIYYVIKLYYPNATKFAITLLWLAFGISLFITGIIKNINLTKYLGTGLIFISILKAFFFDLSKLDSIYKIVLFMILGVILFILSYVYQSKLKQKEIN